MLRSERIQTPLSELNEVPVLGPYGLLSHVILWLSLFVSFVCSLILMVMEAGIDVDLSTLQLVGTRGFMVAFFGSLVPIGIGMFLAWMMNVGDVTAIIATGAVFGPTSIGIALNTLRAGGILNT